jgi:hypothetical protein
MSKTTKIVISVVVAVVVVVAGYVFLSGRNNDNVNQNASNNAGQGIIMGTGNPYDADHLQRTLNQGGTPGDGGGG